MKEIHVCSGTYSEQITLDLPISLRGGYACGNFSRDTGAFGSRVNEVKLFADKFSGPPGQASPTLTITGAAVGSATEIDGFTISGGVSGQPLDLHATGVVAVKIANGAAPHVFNNVIDGGGVEAQAGPGSTAVAIVGPANPEISGNSILGGNGKTTADNTTGSVGISVDLNHVDSNASIHDNEVRGGSGQTTAGVSVGSTGLLVFEPAPAAATVPRMRVPIEKNGIYGGSGSQTAATANGDGAFGSLGVNVSVAGVTLQRNFIDGGSGRVTAPAGAAAITAIRLAFTAPPVVIEANRIFAGSQLPDPFDSRREVRTIHMVYGALVDVVNNFMIGPGTGATTKIHQGSFVRVAGGNNNDLIMLRHNTFVPQPGVVFDDFATVDLAGGNSTYVIENNLFLPAATGTAGRSAPFRIREKGAPSNTVCDIASPQPFFHPELASVKGNSFVMGTNPNIVISADEPPAACDVSMVGFTSHFGSAVTVGNQRASSSCFANEGSSCVTETCNAATCASTYFSTWGANGLASLADPDAGLRLAPNTRCSVSSSDAGQIGSGTVARPNDAGFVLYPDSGRVIVRSVPLDAFMAQRTLPVSRGAHELDGPCN
ncbi:MAG: hypothetical protein JWM74_919 [Myxococcaceae bacterium]|nr:hypothetical protein [Myxococcaceae bacterium]